MNNRYIGVSGLKDISEAGGDIASQDIMFLMAFPRGIVKIKKRPGGMDWLITAPAHPDNTFTGSISEVLAHLSDELDKQLKREGN